MRLSSTSNDPAAPSPGRGAYLALFGVLGSLYFVQGIVEPTAGMLSQPLQTRLSGWGLSAGYIGQWMALLGLPWTLKPLFGLLTDFVPLLGYRRWTYLLAATAASTFAFWGVYSDGVATGGFSRGFSLLLIATAGVALTDVVIDAWAVKRGQPLGITGQLQSVQWGATSVAAIIAGSAGGYLAEHDLLKAGLGLCAGLSAASLLVCGLLVREQRPIQGARASVGDAWRALSGVVRSPLIAAVGGFLLLWSFNPFSNTVQQLYMTQELGMDEQFFGHLTALFYAAGAPACVIYGLLCRRIPFGWLIHGSIVMGVLSTLAYWGMYDKTSAVVVTLCVGFCYMLGTLVQLDLAARVCPLECAGTVFALLMALSNLGMSLGTYSGGHCYDWLAAQTGSRHAAFDLLVALGAVAIAGCWLLAPSVQRLAGRVGS